MSTIIFWANAGTRPSFTPSSRRRQHQKLTRSAQRHVLGQALLPINSRNPRAGRALPAGLEHRFDLLLRSRKQRLDRAVAAVAHPAFEAEIERHVFSPGAIADALHAAADHDTADRHAHPTSPVSFARAPCQPDGDQRLSVST